MQVQSELMSLPQTLGEMFTRARPDYERAVRGIRWGEVPVYVLGSAGTLPAGLVAGYAVEGLLGYPVVVREVSSFLSYALGTVRSGSLVVAISSGTSAEPDVLEVVEAVQAARKLGAQVLAVTYESSPLCRAADRLFALPDVAGAPATGLAEACLEHAAVAYLTLIAARLFKRPNASLDRLEKDWRELPRHLDWIVSQLPAAVRSFAAELRSSRRIYFAGGGLYHPAALRAANLAPREDCVLGIDLAGLRSDRALTSDAAVVFLSGSRGRMRKEAADLATALKARGTACVAVTDSNDHDLIRAARLALLLPDLAELPGSILALAVGGWVAREMVQHPRTTRAARRSASVSSEQQAH
ncbi:MAG TPA: SIS domain-containing protein [Terriglobia bacterium]